jgi:hypothetical protein
MGSKGIHPLDEKRHSVGSTVNTSPNDISIDWDTIISPQHIVGALVTVGDHISSV